MLQFCNELNWVFVRDEKKIVLFISMHPKCIFLLPLWNEPLNGERIFCTVTPVLWPAFDQPNTFTKIFINPSDCNVLLVLLWFPQTRGNTSSPEPLSAPCSPLLPPLQTPPTKSVTREEAPVLKIAERVRLRRTDERHITGPDITNLGVRYRLWLFVLFTLSL